MEGELVTVIIPTYKRHDKLNRSLRSVVNQTYDNLEIIVVNDCPNEIIDEHIEIKDERIKTINLNENRGGSGARNVGIENANGKYIAFLDDDDEYLPEKIEKQVEKIEELPTNYGLVATGVNLIFENSKKICRESESKKGQLYQEQLRSNQVRTVTPLVKNNCFGKVGKFDESLEARQDYEMWLRILKKYKIAFVEEPLVNQYIGYEDRISRDPAARYKGSKRVFEKHKQDILKDKTALRKHYMRMGLELAYFDTYKAAKYLLKSLYLKRSLVALLTLFFPVPLRRGILNKIREIKKVM